MKASIQRAGSMPPQLTDRSWLQLWQGQRSFEAISSQAVIFREIKRFVARHVEFLMKSIRVASNRDFRPFTSVSRMVKSSSNGAFRISAQDQPDFSAATPAGRNHQRQLYTAAAPSSHSTDSKARRSHDRGAHGPEIPSGSSPSPARRYANQLQEGFINQPINQ